jgi:hypothetical protein
VLRLDLTIANRGSGDRWFVIPGRVPPAPEDEAHSVIGLEAIVLVGVGRIVAGRLIGPGAATLFLLPGGAEVEAGGIAVECWGDIAGQVTLGCAVAEAVVIDGEPAESWFPVDARSEDGSRGTTNGAELAGARHSDGLRTVAVAYHGSIP